MFGFIFQFVNDGYPKLLINFFKNVYHCLFFFSKMSTVFNMSVRRELCSLSLIQSSWPPPYNSLVYCTMLTARRECLTSIYVGRCVQFYADLQFYCWTLNDSNYILSLTTIINTPPALEAETQIFSNSRHFWMIILTCSGFWTNIFLICSDIFAIIQP